MKTTYFWKACHEPIHDVKYISISRNTPDYCSFDSYPDLFPSLELIQTTHKNDYHNFEAYKEAYESHLSKLDPKKVYEDLKDATIVCYESSKI